jgi:hypothetical protein
MAHDRSSDASPGKSPPARISAPGDLSQRIQQHCWVKIGQDLDERGHARLPELLCADECAELIDLYDERDRFRSFIDMDARRYGEGNYRYFARPLPAIVHSLQSRLYQRLAPIANRWQEELGREERYPGSLEQFIEICQRGGQGRPTPLLLRYERDGYNCMHQDVYGAIAFPLQVVCLLSSPASGPEPDDEIGNGFGGGAFLSSEQRPRQQARCEAIDLARGEGLVFPNQVRPVKGKRGFVRAQMRHGLSRVHWGVRYALGVIFHDAE